MTDSEQTIRAYLDPENGPIARRLENYELRPEQLELDEAIEDLLRQPAGQHLCAEAGTGVGKSFAYLLPAAIHAANHTQHGPIVVSTRTIALQEQLEQKDVPFLQAITPDEWTAATVVGRNNYICLRRLNLARREADVLFPDELHANEVEDVVEWAQQHDHHGLRSELPNPVDDRVWDEVKAEHGNCLNRACKFYEQCPYQSSRRRIETTQILIVNHALYMADVALRMAGAQYLPEHRLAIFDEAHHLERVATESLGLRLTIGTIAWHLRRLHPRRSSRSLMEQYGSARARLLIVELRQMSVGFFDMLEERVLRRGGSSVALGDEVLDDPISELILELAGEVERCAAVVEDVDARTELGARARGLLGLHAVIGGLVSPDEKNATVRWIEPSRKLPVLRSAPVDVSAALREHVFGAEKSTVLVSATLGPPGDPDFAWFRGQLGIDKAKTLRLGSPFDYSKSVQIEVAEAMPDPGREASDYLRECKIRVRDAILDNGGRALVLCTSWRFVTEIAEALEHDLDHEGIELLVQGQAPLQKLLVRKREVATSVLIGTDSLWEGIDLQGDVVTLLIVTKFPFAQPDHPLTQARNRAIEARGGNPFAEQSLPEAILKFRQGFGRLIRSGQDRGKVLILDPRARTRRYGRDFLDALPDGAQLD